MKERPQLAKSLLEESMALIKAGKLRKPLMIVEAPISKLDEAVMGMMRRKNT